MYVTRSILLIELLLLPLFYCEIERKREKEPIRISYPDAFLDFTPFEVSMLKSKSEIKNIYSLFIIQKEGNVMLHSITKKKPKKQKQEENRKTHCFIITLSQSFALSRFNHPQVFYRDESQRTFLTAYFAFKFYTQWYLLLPIYA